jgi:hypothetical protein
MSATQGPCSLLGRRRAVRQASARCWTFLTAGSAKRALAACVGQLGPAHAPAPSAACRRLLSWCLGHDAPQARLQAVFALLPATIHARHHGSREQAMRQGSAGRCDLLVPNGANLQASPQFVAHLSCSIARWYPNRAKPARAVLFYGYLRPRAWPLRQNK